MAYNVKDVFFLDETIETTTGAGDGTSILDISSYVQPVVRKGQKATGLAIYKVHWDVMDAASNDAVAPPRLECSGLLSFQTSGCRRRRLGVVFSPMTR